MPDLTFKIFAFTALLAPLASFATVCLMSGRSSKLVSSLSVFWMLSGLIAALVLLLDLWNTPALIAIRWFSAANGSFSADLAFSNKTLIMLFVVAFISFAVHLYSTAYMKGDANWKRYFAMLGFFTFSMQGIVMSDDLLLIFIFWELVGFSSYLLIGHETKNREAGKAASKAFIMNRIGDAGFIIGLMIVWTSYHTFSITSLETMTLDSAWQTAAALCIFCGIIGKSAQFPLFTWLPDAMEGPTPVSALIHAATMVAAGVYLLVRIFNIFTTEALVVVAITGMLTAVIGALAALSQYDIKKILAYSTMSQLGLMILALGGGVADAAFLHLVTHAFFKACLFLSAGIVIHSLHKATPGYLHFNIQDIRNMGGLRKHLPVTFVAFLIAGASLAGVPFFSGYLSKEAILTSLLAQNGTLSWLMIIVVMAVSFLTAVYSFRMIWFVFFGHERTIKAIKITESRNIMSLTVTVLAMGSLWPLVSWNPFDYDGWLLSTGEHGQSAPWIAAISVLWIFVALVVSWFIFRNSSFRTNSILRNSFYIDRFYQTFFGNSMRVVAHAVTSTEHKGIDRSLHGLVYGQVILAHVVAWIDRTFIDGAVNMVASFTGFGGKITRSFHGGNVQLYIFWAVFAVIIFIIWAV